MSEVIPDDLARRWYEYWRLLRGTRDERKALEAGEPRDVLAYEWVSARVERGGVAAVQVLAELAEAAPEGDNGLTVGVGPVEDLLYAHGDAVVDVLMDRARRTPALAHVLAHVSLADGSVSASSHSKLNNYRRQ